MGSIKKFKCTSISVPVSNTFAGKCDGTEHILFDAIGPAPTAAVIRFTNNATAAVGCPITFVVTRPDGASVTFQVPPGGSFLFSFGPTQSIKAICPNETQTSVCTGGFEGTFFFCICCDSNSNVEDDKDNEESS
ncbi:S-Ena type endospore appendage [Neobacillus sp. SAB-20_R2A]|uniref:S-Ena type endospore appendage n=1 Tax=Neobacillus sp. SAB-20_R2A TaxID=3120519 RepID=UPI003C6E4C03